MSAAVTDTWVSTDDDGAQRVLHVEYSTAGYTAVSRELMTELLTKAGLRLRLDVEPDPNGDS